MNPHAHDGSNGERDERGVLLVELMIALVVLAIGVLAIAQVFPAGSRSQLSSRLSSTANFFVQQKAEELMGIPAGDAAFSTGRHPATGADTLGTGGNFQRFYDVDSLGAPLSVRRVRITVQYNSMGTRTETDTIYLRR
jgi:Tfp pilus assembly protein PilV